MLVAYTLGQGDKGYDDDDIFSPKEVLFQIKSIFPIMLNCVELFIIMNKKIKSHNKKYL